MVQNIFVDDSDEIRQNDLRLNGVQRQLSENKSEGARTVYNQQELHKEMVYDKSTIMSPRCGKLNGKSMKLFLLHLFPIITWVRKYKKDYFVGDVISGATVCTLHTPGMGHALLARLPPVAGIYMGFYPVLLYAVFATSMHNSLGTFSVIALMTEKSVAKYASPQYLDNQGNSTDNFNNEFDHGYTPLEVAGLLCFVVGIIQILMYVCRLGIVAFLLSDCLVSGLTTGAAFHIISAQVKDFVGVKIPLIGAHFKIIKTFIEIFKRFQDFNYATLTLFVITSCILVVNNEWLKPRIAKKTKFPIPMELIIIVSSMLLSKYLDIEGRWSIKLVGEIPYGLPEPTMPRFTLWMELITDAIAIVFVSFSVSVSLALVFAQKSNYEIDFNQELLAMGAANIAGAFFSCFPVSAALGRTSLQFQFGGKTQFASIVNAFLIMCILLWIAPLFEILPRCVLSALIVIAVKPLIVQVKDFPKFWCKSKIDAAIWFATCFFVVIVAIDIGLLIGVSLSVLGLMYNSLKPHVCVLGHVPETNLYLDVDKFERAIEIPNVKIFHYGGNLNFATKTFFKERLCNKLRINLQKELKVIDKKNKKESAKSWNFEFLILDFSALSYIDTSSVNMLNNIIKDLTKLNVKVHISGCSTKVYESLSRNDFEFMDNLYPTVNDAVICLK